MENASQALLIAGGILIAILTLTVLVLLFNNMSIIGNAQARQEETDRLQAWNAEWEAYNKSVLLGADVLTVINKAEQNNQEYNGNEKYTIKIEVYAERNLQDKEYVENRKTFAFECISLEYSAETGRVNKMVFNYRS